MCPLLPVSLWRSTDSYVKCSGFKYHFWQFFFINSVEFLQNLTRKWQFYKLHPYMFMHIKNWSVFCKIPLVYVQVMMQRQNRQMSFSLYIAALAVSDTMVVLTGKSKISYLVQSWSDPIKSEKKFPIVQSVRIATVQCIQNVVTLAITLINIETRTYFKR